MQGKFFSNPISLVFDSLPDFTSIIVVIIIILNYSLKYYFKFFKNKRKLIRLVEELRVIPDLDKVIGEFKKNEIKILIVVTSTSLLIYYFFKSYLCTLNFFGISILTYTLISLILFLSPIAIEVFYLFKNVELDWKHIRRLVSFTSFLLSLLFFTSILFGGCISIIASTITTITDNTGGEIFLIIFSIISPIILILPTTLYVISFHMDLYAQKLVAEINKKISKVRRRLPLFLLKVEDDKIEGKIIGMNFKKEEVEIITKDGVRYFIPLNKVSEFFGIKYKSYKSK